MADQPRGLGLALFLSEGMPGWLKNVAAVIRVSMPRRTADAAESPAAEPTDKYAAVPTWLRGVANQDLTALLTSLVLSVRRQSGRAGRDNQDETLESRRL